MMGSFGVSCRGIALGVRQVFDLSAPIINCENTDELGTDRFTKKHTPFAKSLLNTVIVDLESGE